jgi:hypothetical protein
MFTIVEFSRKWEGISKSWSLGSSLPNKVSSEAEWWLAKTCIHETASITKCKLNLCLTYKVGKVPVGVITGDCCLLYQDVSSTMVNHYSRTMMEQDVWQNVPRYNTALSPWLVCVIIILFPLAYQHHLPSVHIYECKFPLFKRMSAILDCNPS